MSAKEYLINEKNKLAEMSFKKKVSYIIEYYKYHIIAVISTIAVIAIFVHNFRISSRPVFLNMIMINSDIAYDDTNYVMDDFAKYANVDADTYNLTIDPGYIISTDDSDQVSYANSEKLMVMYASSTLDVVIAPESIMDNYSSMGSNMDLSKELPEDLLNKLSDKGYEFYYASIVENTDDEDAPPIKGEPYLAGIYLDNSDYLNSLGSNGAYSSQLKKGERPVFSIVVNAKDKDNAILMLKMLTGI